MDLEGMEFELLERILEDGTYKLIDEVTRPSDCIGSSVPVIKPMVSVGQSQSSPMD
jgi:hypothetical protein